MAVKQKLFVKNEALREACDRAKTGSGRIHFLGLVCISLDRSCYCTVYIHVHIKASETLLLINLLKHSCQLY